MRVNWWTFNFLDCFGKNNYRHENAALLWIVHLSELELMNIRMQHLKFSMLYYELYLILHVSAPKEVKMTTKT